MQRSLLRSSACKMLVLSAMALLGLACVAQPAEQKEAIEQEAIDEQSAAVTAGTVSTDANLKVAFIGDTADGSNYKAVLDLIKAEGALVAVAEPGGTVLTTDPHDVQALAAHADGVDVVRI
jgi:hypothetical protein